MIGAKIRITDERQCHTTKARPKGHDIDGSLDDESRGSTNLCKSLSAASSFDTSPKSTNLCRSLPANSQPFRRLLIGLVLAVDVAQAFGEAQIVSE